MGRPRPSLEPRPARPLCATEPSTLLCPALPPQRPAASRSPSTPPSPPSPLRDPPLTLVPASHPLPYPPHPTPYPGGKVFMYNPYAREPGSDKAVRYLNINKQITAVCAGALDPSLDHDVLLVGTAADLLAYNVDNNSELFFKDLPDGASRLACGRAGSSGAPVAVVGGNCSLQGFDAAGAEVFWTVNGDNVSALELADINADGLLELLVGSEDFEIRALKDEDALWELTEADRVSALAHVQAGRFGYALANGTVGAYDGPARQWRVKSKYAPTALAAFDLDGDGVPELISGWSNGKVEARAETPAPTRSLLASCARLPAITLHQ